MAGPAITARVTFELGVPLLDTPISLPHTALVERLVNLMAGDAPRHPGTCDQGYTRVLA